MSNDYTVKELVELVTDVVDGYDNMAKLLREMNERLMKLEGELRDLRAGAQPVQAVGRPLTNLTLNDLDRRSYVGARWDEDDAIPVGVVAAELDEARRRWTASRQSALRQSALQSGVTPHMALDFLRSPDNTQRLFEQVMRPSRVTSFIGGDEAPIVSPQIRGRSASVVIMDDIVNEEVRVIPDNLAEIDVAAALTAAVANTMSPQLRAEMINAAWAGSGGAR